VSIYDLSFTCTLQIFILLFSSIKIYCILSKSNLMFSFFICVSHVIVMSYDFIQIYETSSIKRAYFKLRRKRKNETLCSYLVVGWVFWAWKFWIWMFAIGEFCGWVVNSAWEPFFKNRTKPPNGFLNFGDFAFGNEIFVCMFVVILHLSCNLSFVY